MTTSKLINIGKIPEYKPVQFHRQKTEWLFPVPLWGFGLPNCEDINKNIENRVYEKSKEEETRLASNEGGWHSDGSMHDDPVMEPIIKFIEWGVKELGVESKMEYKDYQIFLWANINRPGDYNTSKKDKRYRNKKNRKNNKIDFRTLELEEDDDLKIDRYWDET